MSLVKLKIRVKPFVKHRVKLEHFVIKLKPCVKPKFNLRSKLNYLLVKEQRQSVLIKRKMWKSHVKPLSQQVPTKQSARFTRKNINMSNTPAHTPHTH